MIRVARSFFGTFVSAALNATATGRVTLHDLLNFLARPYELAGAVLLRCMYEVVGL
jgi:hypothetical protein